MDQFLIFLLMFTVVVPLVLSVQRKYYLIQQSETWNDAQTYCRTMYNDLATIVSAEDMTEFQNEIQAQGFSSKAWIGLYNNVESWYWSLSNESLGVFTDWASIEPNNWFGNEQCTILQKGSWYDAPCSWQKSFLCYDETLSGSDRYVLFTQDLTWYDAQSYCRQYHTDLASARNSAENTIIELKNYYFWTWIGLRRDPWKWSDQSTSEPMISWSYGDTNDYIQNKSCAFINNGVGDLSPCSDTMPFVCYLPTNQNQLIRMTVMSTLDANDPLIMATIFEKIKQKLEDHGMTQNITVKWRKQTDGSVFHKEAKEKNSTLVINPRECNSF